VIPTVSSQEQILGLEIAMHDAFLVCGREPIRDLDAPLDRLTWRDPTSDLLAQRRAVEQLHDEVRRRACRDLHVVNRQDVGMRQRGDGGKGTACGACRT
jgi:hypothetical protein